MLWTQNDEGKLLGLPKSRLVNKERTHFVLVDSQHYLRYVMLDQDNQVSFNSSSVLTNVELSHQNMAQLSLMPSTDTKRSYASDVLSGIYDRRQIQFNNVTGRMYVTAEASHYLTAFTSAQSKQLKAKDAMRGVY